MSTDDDNKRKRDSERLRKTMEQAGLLNSELVNNAKTASQAVMALRSQWASLMPKQIELTGAAKMIADWKKSQAMMADRLNGLIASVQMSDLKRMFSAFDWIAEEVRKSKLVEKTGWLPHRTTPFDRLNAEQSDEEMSSIIAEHYRDNWPEVEQAFVEGLGGYTVDFEAQETLREALAAHRHGLYRVAPRLLFPEIERVAANEFYGGKHTAQEITSTGKTKKNPITRLSEIRENALDLPLGEMADYKYSWHLFEKVRDHLYEQVGEDDAVIEGFRADPVPNRHAALHGLVSYKTQQSSLNTIIMTDFMFHLITQLKKYQAEEGDAEGD